MRFLPSRPTLFAAAVCCLNFVAFAGAQAPGDDRAAPILAPGPGVYAFDATAFTTPNGALLCNDLQADPRDVWFLYTAGSTGAAVVSVCSGSYLAPGGAVLPEVNYLGATGPGVSECSNGALACGGFAAEVAFPVVAGAAYEIVLGSMYSGPPVVGALAIAETPAVELSQPLGPGSFRLRSYGLLPGADLYHVLSLDCAYPGQLGPYFGLFAADPFALVAQTTLPLGVEPFRVVATGSQYDFGPFVGFGGFAGVVVQAVVFESTPAGGRLSPPAWLLVQ
jgi:hypothetical protein